MQCSPISSAWQPWNAERVCVNIYSLWYSNAIYNIFTDFAIVLMVPPVIFTLKLPMRQKIALTVVFGLGGIVCAASISRLTTLYASAHGPDATAGSLVSTIWTTVEAGLGIICANLPMLRTPIQYFFPRLFPSRSGTTQISSRSISLPCRSSHSTTMVSPLAAPQDPPCLAGGGGAVHPRQVSYGSSNTVNDISYPRDEYYWRPCLDSLPESGDLELRTVHGLQATEETLDHGSVAEQDWYQCQHKVW